MRAWLTGTFAGRAIAGGVLAKLAAALLGVPFRGWIALGLLDALGSLALLAGVLVLAHRVFRDVRRLLLWRVRRKLTLSYIFIGVVPALLTLTFFVVAGLLLFFNIGSYLLRSRLEALVEQAAFLAESTAIELQRARSDADLHDIVERRQTGAASRYPNASYAVVPADLACDRADAGLESRVVRPALRAGPWAHVDAPEGLPQWVSCAGGRGLLAYREGAGGPTRLAARAVVVPAARRARFAVVVDIPVGETLLRQWRADTGIQVGGFAPVEDLNGAVRPLTGRAIGSETPGGSLPDRTVMAGPANIVLGEESGATLRWATLVDFVDWESGRAGSVVAGFEMRPLETYRRISATSLTGFGNLDFGQFLLAMLAAVGGLFLVIQAVALGMGLGLARSITGAIHELFTGTERVRRGDFTHRIPIQTRDQLGELAESFNSMTASIEDLLREKAEKERLEQELRIARQIQMSLLPQGALVVPGMTVTAHCEPAREVGGDYYDFLPIDERRLGILIADVSGKGTSAALYMAELKGLVLSLSQLHTSPRRLLVDANRIISRHLDRRSFITVTYAVVDLHLRTLTYARAGHCPLIYRPGPYAARRDPQVLAPDGLVLGLQVDDGSLFTRLLEEATIALGSGDLCLLFTDGITEAMDAAGECFGEERLARLVAEHGDRGPEELRERILRDVRAFAGTAGQQDDITLVLLTVGELAA